MSTTPIRAGSRVNWTSKANNGRGQVTDVTTKRTGVWVTVKTKDHPAGQVTVRLSQVFR